MSTQETAQINAIGQQAQDTDNQANLMLQGANSMMSMAICGLACGLGTSAYSMAGVASASKEGDQAETEAMQKQATSVEDTSEKSISEMHIAASNPGSKESAAEASRSAAQLQATAKNDKTPEGIQQSANEVATNVNQVANHAPYQPGGPKANEDYINSKAYKDSLAKEGDDKFTNQNGEPITTPEQAVAFYSAKAEKAHTELTSKVTEYNSALKQGIRPGREISLGDARKHVIANRTEEETKQVPNDGSQESEKAITDKATAYQAHIKSLKSPSRSSPEWHQAYSEHYQKIQLFTNVGTNLSQFFLNMGQSLNAIQQAGATKEQAAAQTQSSTEQAMGQGVSQTQQTAEQLRQSMNTIAGYMAQDADQKM